MIARRNIRLTLGRLSIAFGCMFVFTALVLRIAYVVSSADDTKNFRADFVVLISRIPPAYRAQHLNNSLVSARRKLGESGWNGLLSDEEIKLLNSLKDLDQLWTSLKNNPDDGSIATKLCEMTKEILENNQQLREYEIKQIEFRQIVADVRRELITHVINDQLLKTLADKISGIAAVTVDKGDKVIVIKTAHDIEHHRLAELGQSDNTEKWVAQVSQHIEKYTAFCSNRGDIKRQLCAKLKSELEQLKPKQLTGISERKHLPSGRIIQYDRSEEKGGYTVLYREGNKLGEFPTDTLGQAQPCREDREAQQWNDQLAKTRSHLHHAANCDLEHVATDVSGLYKISPNDKLKEIEQALQKIIKEWGL